MRIAEIFRSLQGEGRLTGVDSVFVRAAGATLRCGFCDTPYASWSPEGEDLSVDEILERVQTLSQQPAPVSDSRVQGSGFRIQHSYSAHHPLPTAHCAHPSSFIPHPSSFPPASGLRPPASNHVVLTGGEPMLFAELIPLTAALGSAGWHITIETSGTLYLPVACDLMSISPKLSNSTPPLRPDPRWTHRHDANRNQPQVVERLIAEYDYQIKFVIDTPADCDDAEKYLASMRRHRPRLCNAHAPRNRRGRAGRQSPMARTLLRPAQFAFLPPPPHRMVRPGAGEVKTLGSGMFSRDPKGSGRG